MITRPIPTTGQMLPAIGLGTWQTFNVTPSQYPALEAVLNVLHKAGGRLIDTSPMYGSAEEAVGQVTASMPQQDDFFYATKLWTRGAEEGKTQLANSYSLLKRTVMDLVQIHNLVDWKIHLPYLCKLKEEGKLRFIGITHYQDSSHEALATIIKNEPIDFVQFNYSIFSRHAETLLLPLCAERGIATLINRPFGEGDHFRAVSHKPLPPWAIEWEIDNWGAFFLKFILAHPSVTCVIPATGKIEHAVQNLQAGSDFLPDAAALKKMADYVRSN